MSIQWIYLVMVLGMISVNALASDRLSQHQVQSLVAEGKILDLTKILEMNHSSVNGRLLDVELETEHNRLIYELEILQESGRVYEFEIDATNGQILEVEREE